MDNEMNLQEPIKSSNTSAEEEMKTLAQKLFMAKMDLGKTKSARKRRDLQEYIDGLKVDLGWTFLDCKEYEKGLALLSSVSWKTHGEMKCNGMEIAIEGLRKFSDEDPVLYQNVVATFWEMGWRNETIEVLKKGVEKFLEDEEPKKFLKDVEDDTDDPDGGVRPPVLGLILLMAILQKKIEEEIDESNKLNKLNKPNELNKLKKEESKHEKD
jgi:hypothetical protein